MVTISHEVEFEFDAGEYWEEILDDMSGLASGKPETYYRTQSSGWATEEIFVKYYQQIREK